MGIDQQSEVEQPHVRQVVVEVVGGWPRHLREPHAQAARAHPVENLAEVVVEVVVVADCSVQRHTVHPKPPARPSLPRSHGSRRRRTRLAQRRHHLRLEEQDDPVGDQSRRPRCHHLGKVHTTQDPLPDWEEARVVAQHVVISLAPVLLPFLEFLERNA